MPFISFVHVRSIHSIDFAGKSSRPARKQSVQWNSLRTYGLLLGDPQMTRVRMTSYCSSQGEIGRSEANISVEHLLQECWDDRKI